MTAGLRWAARWMCAPPAVPGAAFLLDPRDLRIDAAAAADLIPAGGVVGAGTPDTTTDHTIRPSDFQNLSGAVTLAATRDLTVASPVTPTTLTALTLEAGLDLLVAAPIVSNTLGS